MDNHGHQRFGDVYILQEIYQCCQILASREIALVSNIDSFWIRTLKHLTLLNKHLEKTYYCPMNSFNVSLQAEFRCCFVCTLLTQKLLNFMSRFHMFHKDFFLICFVFTVYAWIFFIFMDCFYMFLKVSFLSKYWLTLERDAPPNPCLLPSTINSPQCQELMVWRIFSVVLIFLSPLSDEFTLMEVF